MVDQEMDEKIDALRSELKADLMQHKADYQASLSSVSDNLKELTHSNVQTQKCIVELTTNMKELSNVRAKVEALTESNSDLKSKIAVAEAFITKANVLVWAVVTLVVVIVVKAGFDVSA